MNFIGSSRYCCCCDVARLLFHSRSLTSACILQTRLLDLTSTKHRAVIDLKSYDACKPVSVDVKKSFALGTVLPNGHFQASPRCAC